MRHFKVITFKLHLIIGLLIRFIFIFYGIYHDQNSHLKYTDVDYKVFTDASRHILQNESPYERHTYRYSPLIALILTPNIFLSEHFGKILFCIIDILVAILLKVIISYNIAIYYRQNTDVINLNDKCNLSIMFWLYNPISITISTRGNCDTLAGFLVLLTLYLLECKKKYFLAGLIHGIAIHLRLYPLIYSLAMYMSLSTYSYYSCKKFRNNHERAKVIDKSYLNQLNNDTNVVSQKIPDCDIKQLTNHDSVSEPDGANVLHPNILKQDSVNILSQVGTNYSLEKLNSDNNRPIQNSAIYHHFDNPNNVKDLGNNIGETIDSKHGLERKSIFKKKYVLYLLPNVDQILLIAGCLCSLTILTVVFVQKYGYIFLYETYIYHLIRKDTRHNFSLYFYMQYLTAGIKMIGLWEKILIILPQIILNLIFSIRYGLNKYSLNFAILTQTITVVSYNSVLTSQYFVWVLVILPLCLWQLQITIKLASFLIGIWLCAQLAWLLPAYLLEFRGQNTLFYIWLQSLSFFCANIAILGRLVMHFRPPILKNKSS